LLHEFFNRFPPTKNPQEEVNGTAANNGQVNGDANNMEQMEAGDENKNGDQPVEKKKKI
jgi:hypothetical protein